MTEDTTQQAARRPRKETADRLVQLLSGVSLAIRPEVPQAWPDTELTMHQFRALSLLGRRPHRVSDLAALLGIRFSSATSLVDRMDSDGLTVRVHDSVDHRVVWVKLTARGQQVLDGLWSINRGWVEGVAARLADHELEAVVLGLDLLSGALAPDEVRRPPVPR